jgi:rubredoxin
VHVPECTGKICEYFAPAAGREDRTTAAPGRTLSSKTLIPTMNATAPQADDTPFRKFMCVVCGWIYNEAEGWPDDGIEPGTRWEDIPETWTCPDCGVTKADFEMMEI